MSKTSLKVLEVIQTPNAILGSQGEKLYEALMPLLAAGQVVELDFSDLRVLNSGFCNASVGRIYRELGADKAEAQLITSGTANERQESALNDAISLGQDPDLLKNMREAFEEYLEEQEQESGNDQHHAGSHGI